MHACLNVMFDHIYDLSEFLAMYIYYVTLNACLVSRYVGKIHTTAIPTMHYFSFSCMLIIKIDYIDSYDGHKSDRKQIDKENSSLRSRRPRPGFSDSFSSIGNESVSVNLFNKLMIYLFGYLCNCANMVEWIYFICY